MRAIALCLSIVSATTMFQAPAMVSNWVMLDADFQRQADRRTLRREGPWALFTQRWGTPGNGREDKDLLREEMAVNCLTGAWGAYRYPRSGAGPGEPTVVQKTLAEVEQGQSDSSRISLGITGNPLYANVERFACDCPKHAVAGPASEAALRELYERHYAGPMQRREYHIQFVRLGSRSAAEAAIRELDAGVPIEVLFERYASMIDKTATPRGDLGFNEESGWPIVQQRVLRGLKVGEYTRQPIDGVYGWEIIKLLDLRIIPAPSFEEAVPRLRKYVARAAACAWGN